MLMDSKSPLRLNNLPLDILIDVLKSLPSFGSLLSLILAHRAFNEVWKANFNGIFWAIARDEFQPWEEAIDLMHEQLHPGDGTVASKTSKHLKLSREDIAQMHSNELYLDIVEAYRTRAGKFWQGSSLLHSRDRLLSFRRAAYRVWLFMLTIELPRGELMCDALSLIELIEMLSAVKDFRPRPGWPGLRDFSVVAPEVAETGLEEVMRQRILGYLECDLSLKMIDIHLWKRNYALLNLEELSVDGDSSLRLRNVENLERIEEKWRSQQLEKGKPATG